MKTFADYFEIIKFATPETNVRLKLADNVPKSEEVIIKKCINWEDLMHLFLADNILTRNEIWCKWYVPYKPFARQDRVTALNHANESNMLHQMIYDNLQGRIIFLDVHSDAYKSGQNIHQFSPIKFHNPFQRQSFSEFGDWYPGFHLIVPDKGAQKKIPRSLNSNGVTYCDKKRDPVTGKLSGFNVPQVKASRKHSLVLVDDICDGGGTFIGVAEHLQQYRAKHKLILYVTHGLFTKGVNDLLKFFDEIVTTNSVIEKAPNDRVKILDVLSDEFLKYGLEQS